MGNIMGVLLVRSIRAGVFGILLQGSFFSLRERGDRHGKVIKFIGLVPILPDGAEETGRGVCFEASPSCPG